MAKEEYAKLTEALAKLRDWLQACQELREVIDEFLNVALQNEAEPNLANIKWSQAEGPSRAYELATADDNKESRDFGLLVEDLQNHKTKMTRGDFFLWLFDDQKRVGRKPR